MDCFHRKIILWKIFNLENVKEALTGLKKLCSYLNHNLKKTITTLQNQSQPYKKMWCFLYNQIYRSLNLNCTIQNRQCSARKPGLPKEPPSLSDTTQSSGLFGWHKCSQNISSKSYEKAFWNPLVHSPRWISFLVYAAISFNTYGRSVWHLSKCWYVGLASWIHFEVSSELRWNPSFKVTHTVGHSVMKWTLSIQSPNRSKTSP